MSKKAQVTIFIILGIVLLVIVALSIIYIRNIKVKDVTLNDENSGSERLKNYIKQCDSEILSDYLPKALLTGGYGYYPHNIVRVGEDSYVLSYSAEGVSKGIYSKDMAGEAVTSFVDSRLRACVEDVLKQDNEVKKDQVNLISIKSNTVVEENTILIEYNYTYELNSKQFNAVSKTSISTNFGYFLDYANNLTQIVIDSKIHDDLFNYQFCNNLLESRNMMPKYCADFILDIKDPSVTFLFEHDFFVIFLKKDNEIFPFAIMPDEADYSCS